MLGDLSWAPGIHTVGGENQHRKVVLQMPHHVVQGTELTGWRQAPSAAELPRQPLITPYADYRSKGATAAAELALDFCFGAWLGHLFI